MADGADNTLSRLAWIDQLCDRFEAAFESGGRPAIADFLRDAQIDPATAAPELLRELARIETVYRNGVAAASTPTVDIPRPQPVDPESAAAVDLSQAPILQPAPSNVTQSRDSSSDETANGRPKAVQSYPAELTAFLGPPQATDEMGRLGTYRVLAVLGRGGMGVVFRAEDPSLNRPVALKVMLPTLANSDANRTRFIREARAAAAIDHDNIVHIYQVGEDRGAPYIAMQFLEGEPLDVRIKREPALTMARILRIGRETALGLAAAHKRGLIHRDIKPGNLWLEGKQGRVKILDFGLARAETDEVHLTQSGAIVGTPAYMSPEQADCADVDHRSDLFSLGSVLYRLCTGEMAFKGDRTLAILSALALETPKPPRELNPEVPPALSDLVMRLLAKKPADRPASAEAVAAELENISNQLTSKSGTVESAIGPWAGIDEEIAESERSTKTAATARAELSRQPPRRRRRLWLSVAFLGLLLMGGAIIIIKSADIPQGSKITDTDQGKVPIELPKDPVPTVVKEMQDPDRKAALALNPYVDLTLSLASGKELRVKKGEALPREEFVLKAVETLDNQYPATFADDKLLPALAELRCLESIGDYYTIPLNEIQIERLAKMPLANTLQKLYARFELTAKSVDALKQMPKLELLGCFATQADDATLKRLAELKALKGLSLQSLGQSGRVKMQGLEAITKLPLVSLVMSSSPAVNSAFLDLLAKMPELEHVNLFGCKLRDDDITLIARNPKLTLVGLMSTGITDAGTKHLTENTKLYSVNISFNPGITDASLDSLLKLPDLGHVILRETKVTAAGIKKLAMARPNLTIDWDGGTILPYEADRKAAVALNHYFDLTLKLASRKEVIVKKGETLPVEGFVLIGITYLNAVLPPNFAERTFLPAVAELRFLESMSGPLALQLTEDQFIRLTGLPLAMELNVLYGRFELTPKILERLKQLPKLRTLFCFASTADDAVLSQLSELSSLVQLGMFDLGRSRQVTARSAEAIAKLPLITLALHNSSALDQAFLRILPTMTSLRDVQFWECPLGDEAIPILALIPNIRGLILEKAGVTDAGLVHFAKSSNLNILDLNRNPGITDAGLEMLAAVQSLNTVYVQATKVTAAGIKKLRAARPDMKVISDVDPK